MRTSRRASPRSPPSGSPGGRDGGAAPAGSASGSMPTTKRSWQRAHARGGIALTGVSGLPVLKASTSKVHQPNTCSAGDRPGSPHHGSIAGPSAPPSTSQSASARRTESRQFARHPLGHADLAGRRRRCVAIACASCDAGVGEQPAPVAGVMAALARVDRQVEVASCRASRGRSSAGRRAGAGRRRRSAGRPEELAVLPRTPRAGPGEPVSSPISISIFALKPRRPRVVEHVGQRRDVDRVLALVVGDAAAVPAAVALGQRPRRQALEPARRSSPRITSPWP